MNILDYYKNLNLILSDCRLSYISIDGALSKLNALVKEAKRNGLDVEMKITREQLEAIVEKEEEEDYYESSEEYYEYSDFETSYY